MPVTVQNTIASPRVVAVIVNYNAGVLLRRAVDALLAGTPRPDAVVVVDNASSDGSAAALQADPAYRVAVHFIGNDRNRGFAAANNQVLAGGDADFWLLVNPDCLLEPDTLHELLACMRQDPAVGLAGGALRNPDGTLQKTAKRRLPTPWSGLARSLGLHRLGAAGRLADFDLAGHTPAAAGAETVEAISGAMMLVRGSALADVGLLDEGYFMHCEDLDWCKRFHDAGYRVVYVPSAGALHWKGASGRGPRVVWYLHRGMLRFYNKHYRRHYPWPFSVLVYAGVGLRCATHMLASLAARRS